jgi:hypothetical protein
VEEARSDGVEVGWFKASAASNQGSKGLLSLAIVVEGKLGRSEVLIKKQEADAGLSGERDRREEVGQIYELKHIHMEAG